MAATLRKRTLPLRPEPMAIRSMHQFPLLDQTPKILVNQLLPPGVRARCQSAPKQEEALKIVSIVSHQRDSVYVLTLKRNGERKPYTFELCREDYRTLMATLNRRKEVVGQKVKGAFVANTTDRGEQLMLYGIYA